MAIGTGGGSANGPGRTPYDRWFRYPAGYSPSTLEAALDAVNLTGRARVVDPFAGAGSAAVILARRGHSLLGIEAHPEIAELARLKTTGIRNPERIEADARAVLAVLSTSDTAGETELVRRSFSPEALSVLVAIRDTLQSHPRRRTAKYLKWCLLGALRDCANVQVRWPYQRPAVKRKPRMVDPARAFLRRASWMAADLSTAPTEGGSTVVHGDARVPGTWKRLLPAHRADALVTSPPYMNNFDYADATRLEMFFWGVAESWSDMTTQVRRQMLTATTQQSSRRGASEALDALQSFAPRTTPTLQVLVRQLAHERSLRKRGKEYDQVLVPYFAGMSRVFRNAHAFLKAGAHVVLIVGDSAPYGVHIDTPGLLASVAQETGFIVRDIRLIRERGARWSGNTARHQSPLSEKMVMLAAPRT